jgi:hypothetical protein
MEIPQKLEIELLYDPVIPLLGIYPKECKQYTLEISVHQCSSQHYSQYQNSENNPHTLQLMNGLRNCGINTKWSITEP